MLRNSPSASQKPAPGALAAGPGTTPPAPATRPRSSTRRGGEDLKGTFMTSKLATLANHTPTVKMLLDGKFIESQSSEWHDVVNPATQEVLAQVPFAPDKSAE